MAAVCGGVMLMTPNVATASVSCTLDPATRVLTISQQRDDAFVTRRADQIVVGEAFGPQIDCSGATVFNTDTVEIRQTGLITSVAILLQGGPFAPGATPEATGAPEIEFRIIKPSGVASGDVIGTDRRDDWRWLNEGDTDGINLNPTSNGDLDADVTVEGFVSTLFADGGPGEDKITVDERYGRLLEGTYTNGGRGNDLLGGGSSGDILEGARGNDRLFGGDGGDDLSAGPGRDFLYGGRGSDELSSNDGNQDRLNCGKGGDYTAEIDRKDRTRGCERIRQF